jgi:hypothetical protein
MKLAMLVAIGLLVSIAQGHAAGCVNGVYRAGCAGPNGAAVVRKPYAEPYHHYHYVAPHHYVERRPGVNCASGPYREGCAGPNGAVVRRTP